MDEDLFQAVTIKEELNFQEAEAGKSSGRMSHDEEEEEESMDAESEEEEEDTQKTAASKKKPPLASRKQRRKKKATKFTRVTYTAETLSQALEAVKKGMPMRRAAVNFKVPYSTIISKIHGRTPMEFIGRGGYYSVLGKEIEDELVKWVNESNDRGLFVTKDGLFASVARVKGKEKLPEIFKNEKPGTQWFYSFWNRHPEMNWMTVEKNKDDILTEGAVKHWLQMVDKQLGENSKILACPERVFSVEILSFGLPDKFELILNKPKKQDTERISTIFIANANGNFVTPETFFTTSEEIEGNDFNHLADEWKFGKTKGGRMTPAAFYEYFTTDFMKFLAENKVQKPVIVYMDGQDSYLTLHLSKFCEQHKILLVPLCPDASHMLHPLNVTLFEPIRKSWMSFREDYEKKGNSILTKYKIPLMLNMFLRMDGRKEDLVERFKTTGLRPLNSDFVPETPRLQTPEVFEIIPENPEEHSVSEWTSLKIIKDHIEKRISPDLLKRFQKTKYYGRPWKGRVESTDLFNMWLEVSADFEKLKRKYKN